MTTAVLNNPPSIAQRHPDDQHRREALAGGHDLLECRQRPVGEHLLMQEVVDRVGAQPEFGKEHERGACLRRLAGQDERALGVIGRIGGPHERDRRGDAHKALGVQRGEGTGGAHRFRAYTGKPQLRPVASG